MKKENKISRLSAGEFKKILASLDREDSLLAGFMSVTCTKVSEAISIRVKDISFKTGEIRIFANGADRIFKPQHGIMPLMERHIKESGILSGEYVFFPGDVPGKCSRETKRKRFSERLGKASKEAIGRSIGTESVRGLHWKTP